MTKILFVCHGNICRSPMAESIFRQLLEERKLTGRFEVGSAAVSSEELGNAVYPQAQSELQRRGLPRSLHRAWQLKRADYDSWDLFLCMDHSNLRLIHRIFDDDPAGKIHLIMDYSNHPGEVEDPWYTDRFDHVFDLLQEACEGLLNTLMEEEHD